MLGPQIRRALTRDWLGQFCQTFQDLVGSPTAAKAHNKIRDMGAAWWFFGTGPFLGPKVWSPATLGPGVAQI